MAIQNVNGGQEPKYTKPEDVKLADIYDAKDKNSVFSDIETSLNRDIDKCMADGKIDGNINNAESEMGLLNRWKSKLSGIYNQLSHTANDTYKDFVEKINTLIENVTNLMKREQNDNDEVSATGRNQSLEPDDTDTEMADIHVPTIVKEYCMRGSAKNIKDANYCKQCIKAIDEYCFGDTHQSVSLEDQPKYREFTLDALNAKRELIAQLTVLGGSLD